MTLEESSTVAMGSTLQLYAIISHGNDLYPQPEDCGMFVDETNLSGITWTSSDESIATVDSTGKVTGVYSGNASITAKHNGETATYEVIVKTIGEIWAEQPRIIFNENHYTPGIANVINTEHGFELYLNNIPDTERTNVIFSIENENIAKLENKGLCMGADYSCKHTVVANVKFLALGNTKLTASLSYNGETYTASYDIHVIESNYYLILSSTEYTDLPSTIEIGKSIQLTAMFGVHVGSTLPKDVTNDVQWTTSNTNVVQVNSSGLVNAVGTGSATITAKYTTANNDIYANKYEITVKPKSNNLMGLIITSNHYSIGDTIRDDDVKNLEVTQTLQLYAVMKADSILWDGYVGGIWLAYNTNLSNVIWTSSNTSVANVNSSGLVNAVGTGSATITAKYTNDYNEIITATYKINVNVNNPKTGIIKPMFIITLLILSAVGYYFSKQNKTLE